MLFCLQDPESLEELYDKPHIPQNIDILNVAKPAELDLELLGADFSDPTLTKPEPV